MACTVWLCGVAATVFLWAAIAGAIGFASGRPLAVASDFKLFAPFVLFVAGWTGAWLSSRRQRPAVPAAR
jgi:hypothetical protein